MTSQIDITKPTHLEPTTQSVRDNFTTAKNEISALQALAFSSIGEAQLDFGAKPSKNNSAQVAITGLAGILSTSTVTATLRLEATADHPVDDLLAEPIIVSAGNIAEGVGFTIYGRVHNGTGYGLYNVNYTVRN
jgi:hypothetical protein